MKNQIRVMREKRRMTQTALASRAGLSRVTVNRVESGISRPSVRTMVKLSIALSCSIPKLFPALAKRPGREVMA